MLLSVFTVPVFAVSSVVWTDHGEVFQPPIAAYSPTVLYNANTFGGHGASYFYKMWYSTGTGLALAYSNDGKLWTIYNSGLDLSTLTNPLHGRVIFDAGGFGGSGEFYKIWYWDCCSPYPNPSNPLGVLPVRYAESSDGVNWVNDQAITQDVNYPLVTGQEPAVPDVWFYSSYGPGQVFYNPSGYAVINDADPLGNRYVMYYDASSQGFAPDLSYEATALAYSVDGKAWKRYGVEPIFKAGGSSTWDSGYAYASTVMKLGGLWRMWYSGGIAASWEGCGYAESTDGLSWTRDTSNPITLCGEPNGQDPAMPMVIYDASGFNGHGDSFEFKMYYSGFPDSVNNRAIGYKTGTLSAAVGGHLEPINKAEVLAMMLVQGVSGYWWLLAVAAIVAVAAVLLKRRRS